MSIRTSHINISQLSIAVDIAFQMYLHILRHILRAHRDGVLAGDVILLHHLHGIGAGSHACDGVAGGVAIDDGLIRRLRCAALNELNGHIVGAAVKAGGCAGNRHARQTNHQNQFAAKIGVTAANAPGQAQLLC